jgi:DNA invertase Pin-like site-specific DNA recombinase
MQKQRTSTYLAYGRVSTEEQESGLQVQRVALDAWAVQHARAIEYAEDEGYTGGNDRRPQLQAVRAQLARKDGPAGLVVAKLDRLSRSIADFSRILADAQEQGWTLVCLDPPLDLGDKYGRAFAHTLAVFAQLERELISDRVKEALAYKAIHGTATGNPIGRPPAVPIDVRARIRNDRKAGKSLRNIAEALTKDGVPTAHGGRWHASTVSYVLSAS